MAKTITKQIAEERNEVEAFNKELETDKKAAEKTKLELEGKIATAEEQLETLQY